MVNYYVNRTGLSPAGALALRLFGYVPFILPTPPLMALRLRHRERRRQRTARYKSKHGHLKDPLETKTRRASQRAQRASQNGLQRPLRRGIQKSRSPAKTRTRRWLSYSPAIRPAYLSAAVKNDEDLATYQETLFEGLWFKPSTAQAQDPSLYPTPTNTLPNTPARGLQGSESADAQDQALKDVGLAPEPQGPDSAFDSLVRRLQRMRGDLKDTTPPLTPRTLLPVELPATVPAELP